MTIIKNARIIGRSDITNGCIAYENGCIVPLSDTIPTDAEIIDAGGLYLAPGFVDIHSHGGGGHDFLDGTLAAFLGAAELHAKYGTTTIIPTATSASFEETSALLAVFEEARLNNPLGADMPGIHLEGPYFSPKQCGAQDPRYIRSPQPDEYNRILDASEHIMRWSSAPELEGSEEFAKACIAHGVLPAIGHSDADYDEVKAALGFGFTHVTHLYSATSTVHRKNAYRYAGIVECAYLFDEMTVEIIADGVHLPKPLLEMVYRFIGPDRCALVTDSMRGAGLPDGSTSILGSLENGTEVIIEDGVAKMPDRQAFAGSVATADRLIRTMVKTAEIPLTDAVTMMTATPAKLMKLDDRGTLDIGKRADLVLFDDDINVKMTVIGGKTVKNEL